MVSAIGVDARRWRLAAAAAHRLFIVSLALILVAFAQQPCARCTDASQKRSVCVLSIVRAKNTEALRFGRPI